MNLQKLAILIAALVVGALSSPRLEAAYVAPDLPVGSQYQLIFVTLAYQPQAESADISTYNAIVTEEAALHPELPQGVTWNAVVSTPTVNANVNAPSSGLPVYNTAGELVAPASTGLYTATHLAPISDAANTYGSNIQLLVFTGSNALGTAQSPAGGGLDTYATEGDSLYTNSDWIDIADEINYAERALYGLSSPITVVPEPSTIALLVCAA